MTNRKLQKQMRKFGFKPARQKLEHHEQSDKYSSSRLHENFPLCQEVEKQCFVVSKSFSQFGVVNQKSLRHKRSRMFKHVRKKKMTSAEKISDMNFSSNLPLKEIGLIGSNSLDGSENKHMKEEIQNSISRKESSVSRKDKTFPALKRAFSLRLKSRKDSKSEKIDISSLVKMVNFKKPGKKFTLNDGADITECGQTSKIKPLISQDSKKLKSGNSEIFKGAITKSDFLSPTCGDMYGADEEGFSTSSFENKAISRGIDCRGKHCISDTVESKVKECVSCVRKENYDGVQSTSTNLSAFNMKDSHVLQGKHETYSNLTFHFVKDSNLQSRDNFVSVPQFYSDVAGGKKKKDSNTLDIVSNNGIDGSSCDIIIEDFENPWVLQSSLVDNDKKSSSFNRSVSTVSSVVYESLGFDTNPSDLERSLLSPKSARKTQRKTLKRSASVESLDSFNSSVQSVNSQECLFSSDSEKDLQADQISISSNDSFASAKDFTEQKDLDNVLIEKIRRSSSLDSLNKVPCPLETKVKQLDSFGALDTHITPDSCIKHTFSVDDVHRIIQRPNTLSFTKGHSLDSAPKNDRTPKGDKKKEKNKRRSLDSAFKTAEIRYDFKSELEQQNLKSASSDSGLSSFLSPVQENGDLKLHSYNKGNDSGDKIYHTLPNPRKVKSYPPLLPKKKATRIGSLSKILSEKAESFSGLKLGTSFKLRNLEKPITSGLNKTKSLTSLMSKKGGAVVSSISSYIKGKSTSETNLDMVDSPFKPKTKRNIKPEEKDSVFIYEKVKVFVPRKRPANIQEQVAERRRLTLDLKLSSIKQGSHFYEPTDSKMNLASPNKAGPLTSPVSTSSIYSVTNPTMLDEIMKSVDTRRFSLGVVLDTDNASDTELDEVSSRSSSAGLLSKKQSVVSDITTPGSVFTSDGQCCLTCWRCRQLKQCLGRSFEYSEVASEERCSQSLNDLKSFCLCSVDGNSCDSSPTLGKHKLSSHIENEYVKNGNFMILPLITRQMSMSAQELRHTNDIPFQRYSSDTSLHNSNIDSAVNEFSDENKMVKPKLPARRSLTYSLTKYEPCLDLSADDLDEIGHYDSNEKIYQRNQEKSYSCGDLLEKSDLSFPIIEPVIYSSKQLERKPSKRGDRPVKVKSLSSSHDALTGLTAIDIPDVDLQKQNAKDDNEICNDKSEVTDNNFKLVTPEVKIQSEESSDSGNEDYHSVGSEAEKIDGISHVLSRAEQDSAVGKEIQTESFSDVYQSDSERISTSRPDVEAVYDTYNVNASSNSASAGENFEKSNEVLGDLNDKEFSEDIRNNGFSSQQVKCLECSKIRDKELSELHRQTHRPLIAGKKFCSVNDVNIHDCDKDKLKGFKQKSVSVSGINELTYKCSNCENAGNMICDKLSLPFEKTKTEPLSDADSNSKVQDTVLNEPEIKANTFSFDMQHIKSYKNTQNLKVFSRMKSISSDDVNMQPYFDAKSLKSPVLSLTKLDQKKSPNNIHDKLCIKPDFLPSNLSPLNSVLKLPPFHGFSAFSPPPVDSQLPELEEVYKYDISLGYLIHSITCDNKIICIYSLQRNKQLMEGVITPISGLPGAPHTRPSESSHGKSQKTQHKTKPEDLPNPAAPITVVPSEKLSHAGHVLRTVLLSRASHMVRDRKFHLRTYRRCMVGTEMVDWLLQQSSLVHSRTQAVGMWQALVEEGVIVHVCHEHQFKDKYLFYRFREDDQGVSTVPSNMSKKECEDELQEIFLMLAQIGPDAMMRMILRKLPHERTVEDLEIIYEELLHIKALSHLSTMVKRELASVLVFESHAKAGTVLFNQGDEGKSWYIILKGSVNVVIYGKGVVCTLHEGDDFGKLALVNDAPRAATIVLRDDNCHFLRVDKDDFNRILRDVEANTVRLKEHGQDVLVLEKIPTNTQSADGTVQAHYKYSIMAGTPEKMLEHLLETRLDSKGEEEIGMYRDGFLEDFLLTHVIFMPCNHLCPVLLSHYHSSMSDSTEQENFEFMLSHKKCVLHFVQEWSNIVGNAFREDHTINAFLEELHSCVLEDLQLYTSLREDSDILENILEAKGRLGENQLLTNSGTHPPLSRKTSKENMNNNTKRSKVIKAADENIFKVYCADHTYCTLRLPMDTTVEQILSSARDKLCLGDDLVLCEVKSTGERITFKENDLCVTSGLSINGRLFITPREHQDALTPLPEQEGPQQGSVNTIELVSSREMAYYMTLYDWDLFSCVQEYELIYQVFGRYKFRKITANLDLFLRRFNEIQFWVVTEMVLTTNLSKRVALLRKFIKLASYCKEFQNLNSFFAIVMGLSNIAVSRLSQTWEKLPGKFKKMFADFETLMDPSRNHRVYRLTVAKMVPPIIPFMPLLMKDMTFTHEGNKTYFDGLVNFEKMHMIAQTLKTVRFCRSSNLELEAPSSLKSTDISQYIRNLHVVDNQRYLTQLSHKLEPRKT